MTKFFAAEWLDSPNTRAYPVRNRYFSGIIPPVLALLAREQLQRHRLAAHHNKQCWRAFWGYQRRWPWTTLKCKTVAAFSEFLRFWATTHISRANCSQIAFHRCCRASHEPRLRFLVAVVQIGMTPLLWAAWFGHVDVLQQLVNNGANVHATNLVRYFMVHNVSRPCWNVFMEGICSEHGMRVMKKHAVTLDYSLEWDYGQL